MAIKAVGPHFFRDFYYYLPVSINAVFACNYLMNAIEI